MGVLQEYVAQITLLVQYIAFSPSNGQVADINF